MYNVLNKMTLSDNIMLLKDSVKTTLSRHPLLNHNATADVILAGRKINDDMGKYIAEQTVKNLISAGKTVKGAKVLVFGITFKENVSDIRNSRVIDIITELKEYGVNVIVCDPLADKVAVKHEYNIELIDYNPKIKADGIIIAISHDVFRKIFTKRVIARIRRQALRVIASLDKVEAKQSFKIASSSAIESVADSSQ